MLKIFALRRLFPSLAGFVATLVMSAVAQAAGTPYVAIDPPQPTAAPDKIEVLEFFQYGCPHCRAMAPLVANWEKQQDDDIQLQRIPVAFNPAMTPWQNLYYSLEAMNRLDLHPKVFATVQTERNSLNSRSAVVDWAVKQGLDKSAFESVYDSFGVRTKVSRAGQLIKAYNLESVPALVVDGRYMTSPALANGYQQSLDVADTLVQKVRTDR